MSLRMLLLAVVGLFPVTVLCAFWLAAPLRATETPLAGAPVVLVQELERLPRPEGHYTQGLFFSGGFLYESTGRYGTGAVYKLNAQSGDILVKSSFPQVFLEGIAMLNGVLHVLTWRDGLRLELDPDTLREVRQGPLHGQGWGLCTDGEAMWKSDGSPILTRYEVSSPGTAWKPLQRITITDMGVSVSNLNELEWVNGRIWANVYGSARIAVIDPAAARREDGQDVCPVLFWLDCSALLPEQAKDPEHVLNGIAWDEARDVLLITGKMWPFFSRIALPDIP